MLLKNELQTGSERKWNCEVKGDLNNAGMEIGTWMSPFCTVGPLCSQLFMPFMDISDNKKKKEHLNNE